MYFLVDLLVDSYSCAESDAVYANASSLVEALHSKWLSLSGGDKDRLSESNLMFVFASRFTSLCYSKDFESKMGGFRGIKFLSSCDNLGCKWIWSHELRFVRALLYILKDTQSNLFTSLLLEQCKQVLSEIIQSFSTLPLTDQASKERTTSFNQLISLLISELPNSDKSVRSIVQSCLHQLSEATNSTLYELLLPVKERFLTPILNKPLRALPFSIQIGNIDAIAFCLSIRPSLLTFSEELLRLLHEALALADADDSSWGEKVLN